MNLLTKFEYKILSKNALSNSDDLADYAAVYHFWSQIWKGIFTSVGSPEAFVVDDFYRPDYIPIIKYDGLIVGCLCSTIFNTRNPCVTDMRYFSIFNETSLGWIRERQPRTIMSMEFLTLHSDFRKDSVGFSLAEVMIQLSFMFMKELQVDMAVGVAVKAAGVDKLATNLAAHVIGRDVKRGNLVCNLLGLKREGVSNKHPNPEMDQVIHSLWNNRQYATDTTTTRKAA